MESSKKKGGKRTSARAPNITSATAVPGSPPQIVTNIREHDILLGRGAPTINYRGNVSFRELVSSRKAEYTTSGKHKIKDEIARQVVEEIARRNGRFLRRVETTAEAEALGIPDSKKAWIIADDVVAMEKVKQALRDKDPVRADSPEVDALILHGQGGPVIPPMNLSSSSLAGSLASAAQMPQLFNSLAPSSMNRVASQHDHLLELLHQHSPGHQEQIARANQQQVIDVLEHQLRQQQSQQTQSYVSNLASGLNSISTASLLSSRNQQNEMLSTQQMHLLRNAGQLGDYEQAALALLQERQLQASRNRVLLSQPTRSHFDNRRSLQTMGTSASRNPYSEYMFLSQPHDQRATNFTFELSSGIHNPNELPGQGNGSLFYPDQTSFLRNSIPFTNALGSYADAQQGRNLQHNTSVLHRDASLMPRNVSTLTAVAPTPAVDSLLSSLLRQEAAASGSSAPLTPALLPIAADVLNNSTKPPTPPNDRKSANTESDNIRPTSSSEDDCKPRAKKSGGGQSSSSESSSVVSNKGDGEMDACHGVVKKRRRS